MSENKDHHISTERLFCRAELEFLSLSSRINHWQQTNADRRGSFALAAADRSLVCSEQWCRLTNHSASIGLDLLRARWPRRNDQGLVPVFVRGCAGQVSICEGDSTSEAK